MEKTRKAGEKRLSLKLQFTLFFILFVVALYSVVIITTLQQLRGITEAISAELGLPIVRKTAALIDGDAFEALSRTLDPQDPYYEKTRLQMLDIKQASNCIYLYTMAPVEGTVFRYIIDGSTTPDDKENFSPLGMEEDIRRYSKPVLQTLGAKTFQISSIDYNELWGWTISAYGPILNTKNEAVGIIGCDFKAEDVYEQLWSRILQQLILSAVFVIFGFAAYLYMVNGVNRQNQRLIELKEAAEAVSKELQDERDTIAAMKDALRVGLFLMDKHFIIQSHYSRYLESILNVKDLQGKKFTDLLADSIPPEGMARLIEYFVLLFNRSRISGHARRMLESINPIRELVYKTPGTGEEKMLQWTFAPLDRGKGDLFILGSILDITRENELERQLAEEERKNRKKRPEGFPV
ncbi:MAG: hypothetical protein LBU21_01330 [Treponema sp.]|jgi:hypothetical protein|nr:hypothetical protein [Treponema sp.]